MQEFKRNEGEAMFTVALFKLTCITNAGITRTNPKERSKQETIMAETIDEISLNYEEDGQLIVKELDKEILTRGAWTTIVFRYKQWDKKTEDFGKDLYTIRRYRKMKGNYMQQSKFNISNSEQASKIIAALQKWIDK